MAQNSHAYDFATFEEKKPTVVALEPNKKVQRAETRHSRAQSIVNVVVTTLTVGAVMAVVLMMIVSRVRLTQLHNEKEELDSQLAIVQSEYVRLSGEVAAMASTESIEAYAQEHGMQKADASQVQYFSVGDGDHAEIPEEADSHWFSSLWSILGSLFS